MRKLQLVLLILPFTFGAFAQNKGVEVVEQFGHNLSRWCDWKNTDYLKKATEKCAGEDGKACLVYDSLMNKFVQNKWVNKAGDWYYMLDSYLRGFRAAMKKGDIKVQITDVKSEEYVEFDNPSDKDNRFFFVSCNVKISGAMNYDSRDLFYIRKIGENKISQIGPYKERVNKKGRTQVIVNTSNIKDWDGIANGDYNSIEVSYGYSSHFPLNIGVSANYSYLNFGIEYGQNFSNEPLGLVKHTNFGTSTLEGKYFYLMATPGVFLHWASIDCGLGAVFSSYQYESIYTSYDEKQSSFMMKPKVTFHIPVPLDYSSNEEKFYISPHVGYQYIPEFSRLNCWEVGIGLRFRFETY